MNAAAKLVNAKPPAERTDMAKSRIFPSAL